MANEEKAAKQKAKANTPAAPKDDGLIEVRKDGETTRVHSTCLAEHLNLGWAQ